MRRQRPGMHPTSSPRALKGPRSSPQFPQSLIAAWGMPALGPSPQVNPTSTRPTRGDGRLWTVVMGTPMPMLNLSLSVVSPALTQRRKLRVPPSLNLSGIQLEPSGKRSGNEGGAGQLSTQRLVDVGSLGVVGREPGSGESHSPRWIWHLALAQGGLWWADLTPGIWHFKTHPSSCRKQAPGTGCDISPQGE